MHRASKTGVDETSSSSSERWRRTDGESDRLCPNDCSSSLDRTDDYELLASEIQDKNADDVARYYPVFKKKWKELAGM